MAADINIKIGAQITDLQKKLKQAERSLKRSGAKMQSIGASLTMSLTAPITLLGGSILKTAGDFESSMNAMKAVTAGGVESFDQLEAKAKQLGATTQFSANEAAAGMEMLGRNGLTASQILDGAADASLNLAAATGTDLGNAANIATDAMAQFGLKASELAAVTDIITGATVNSKFSIDDFQGAMAQAGGVAGAVGVSFDDFAATVAAISPSFASGADAGTSLKTMLTRLVPESDKAAQMMQQLGIITTDGSNRFFDAQGNMKSMSDVAGILQESFSGLSEAQRINAAKTLFGTDAMRAGLKLAETGATSYDQLKESLMGVTATDVAQTRMEGFNGAMLKLKSAFETLQLAISESGFLDFATSLAESVTGVMLRLSELDPQTLKVAVSIAAVAAAIGPALFAFGKMQTLAATLTGNYRSLVTFVSKMSTVVKSATVSQATFNAVMAANPVGVVVVAVAALVAAFVLAYKNIDSFRNLVDTTYQKVLKPLGEFLYELGIIAFETFKGIASAIFDMYKTAWDVFMNLTKVVLDFFNKIPLVGKIIDWLKKTFASAINFISKAFNNLPALFAGLTAEARNTSDKVISFFKRLALSAEITAKKVQRALTVGADARALIDKQIKALSKQRKELEGQGKEFGVAFREAFDAEMDKVKAPKVKVTTTASAPAATEDTGTGTGTAPTFTAPSSVDKIKKTTVATKDHTEAVKNQAVELEKLDLRQKPVLENVVQTGTAMDIASAKAENYKEIITNFNSQLEGLAAGGLSDLASGLGEGIGAMASGAGNLQTIAGSMLSTIGGVLMQLGKLAIQTGIAIKGIKLALQSLNPAVAVAGGIALVALAKFVQNKAANLSESGSAKLPAFANGGLVTAPTLGMFGEAGPEALIPKKRLDSLLASAENGGNGGVGMLTTRISGNDLEIVLDKTRRRNNRVR